ncbi:hypothetical protein [uncultured Thiothrix sp.]|uniref:hyaluronate lyase N-terminal domain-containing protein n=1 Tax=uncultured Thiothrix sp. TaxID=223185 RepID=UPI00260F16BC|nr:hypothetical protein [uncultured Thiothrix sp.]
MPMKIQLRRITDAQRLALNPVPAAGEPIWTTDTKKLYIGDGTTAGGIVVDTNQITLDGNGKIPASFLPSFVDDVLEAANQAALPATGTAGVLYVTLDTNKVWRWSGTAYIEISPTAGNADTATKLATARAITLTGVVTGSASFDGSANISITTSSTTLAPLANPAFTGAPTAPTATAGTNTTQLATTAFVQATLANLVIDGGTA